MSALSDRIAREHPETNGDAGVFVRPLLDDTVASFRPTLIALSLAVLLLLLTASVDAMHLVIARSAVKRSDVAVRVALGAGRPTLLRRTLVEGWTLGVGGALLGLAWARIGLAAAVARMGTDLPRAGEVVLRPSVAALTLGLGAAIGAAIAVVAFVRSGSWSADTASLRARAPRPRRSRGVLVASQAATAVALLAGAGLLARSLVGLVSVDLGFETEGLLTVRVAFPDARELSYPERLQRFERLAATVAAIPAVRAAGFGGSSPIETGPEANLFEAGRRDDPDAPSVGWVPVSPGYLEAVGPRLLRGRLLDASDGAGSRDVGVVNETLARARFPGEDPIGKQVTIGLDGHDRPITIVGLVEDTRSRGPAADPAPLLYRPLAQTARFGGDAAVLMARLEEGASPAAVVDALRRAAPSLPLFGISDGDELVEPFLRARSALLALVGFFAVTALLLGGVGAYGVTAQAVRERRRDIGVRMALGADRGRILRGVVSSGLGAALSGLPPGILLAWLLGRALRKELFEVGTLDPATLAAVSAGVLAVTLAALALPARAAARTDAAESLRSE